MATDLEIIKELEEEFGISIKEAKMGDKHSNYYQTDDDQNVISLSL